MYMVSIYLSNYGNVTRRIFDTYEKSYAYITKCRNKDKN